jgi:hypothetical protein
VRLSCDKIRAAWPPRLSSSDARPPWAGSQRS